MAGYRSEVTQVATEGMLTRDGHRYNPITMARVNVLQPGGETLDLGFSYPNRAAIEAAAHGYDGNVTTISLGNDYARVVSNDEGPIDFFKEQPDGSYKRSDKFGVVTSALEFLLPDWTGVFAGGEVGPGGGGPVSDAAPVVFDWTKQLREGNGQFKVSDLAIGAAGVIILAKMPTATANSAEAVGRFTAEGSNHTPPQSFEFSAIIDGTEAHALATANGIEPVVGLGTAPAGTPIVMPLGKISGFHIRPLDLQRNAEGKAYLTVEWSMAGREGGGAAGYVWQ